MRTGLVITIRVFVLVVAVLGSYEAVPAADIDGVVAIYSQDTKQLLGAGSIVGPEGLIVTAKHVIIDRNVTSQDYLLSVFFQLRGSGDYHRADLIAIHPYLDVAILMAKVSTSVSESLFPFQIGDVNKEDPVSMMGHKKDDENELHKSVPGLVSQVRNGYMVIGSGVNEGFSGGPVVHESRLVGVIRSTTAFETHAVSIKDCIRYFRMVGVVFEVDGYAEFKDYIKEISVLKASVLDLQTEVNWFARLIPKKENENSEFPRRFVLEISYTKSQFQPKFGGRVTLRAVPVFDNENYWALKKKDRKGFTGDRVFFEDSQKASFDQITPQIHYVRTKKYRGHQINEGDFIGLDVRAAIEFQFTEQTDKNIRVRHVCFELRRNEADGGVVRDISAEGRSCAGFYVREPEE